MTLEQTLERVAVALEQLVAQNENVKTAIAQMETCSCNCAETKEEPKKAKATKKKAEPKAEEVTPVAVAEPVAEEPVADTAVDDLLGMEVGTCSPAYTIDDIRTSCSHILSTGDKQANVAKISEIFKKYGYTKITEIQEKDFNSIMDDLKAVA